MTYKLTDFEAFEKDGGAIEELVIDCDPDEGVDWGIINTTNDEILAVFPTEERATFILSMINILFYDKEGIPERYENIPKEIAKWALLQHGIISPS